MKTNIKRRGRPPKKELLSSTDNKKIDVKAVKKHNPFKGKGGRKKKVKILDNQNNIDDDLDIIDNEQSNISSSSKSGVANLVNGFFYTDEKFIIAFEDDEITKYI